MNLKLRRTFKAVKNSIKKSQYHKPIYSSFDMRINSVPNNTKLFILFSYHYLQMLKIPQFLSRHFFNVLYLHYLPRYKLKPLVMTDYTTLSPTPILDNIERPCLLKKRGGAELSVFNSQVNRARVPNHSCISAGITSLPPPFFDR